MPWCMPCWSCVTNHSPNSLDFGHSLSDMAMSSCIDLAFMYRLSQHSPEMLFSLSWWPSPSLSFSYMPENCKQMDSSGVTRCCRRPVFILSGWLTWNILLLEIFPWTEWVVSSTCKSVNFEGFMLFSQRCLSIYMSAGVVLQACLCMYIVFSEDLPQIIVKSCIFA